MKIDVDALESRFQECCEAEEHGHWGDLGDDMLSALRQQQEEIEGLQNDALRARAALNEKENGDD